MKRCLIDHQLMVGDYYFQLRRGHWSGGFHIAIDWLEEKSG